jgi:protein-tyrosine phosphatase family protein
VSKMTTRSGPERPRTLYTRAPIRAILLAGILLVGTVASRSNAQTSPHVDDGHRHPAPETSIVRFAQIDHDVYKGSRPRKDADYRFLQSKHIKYIVDLKFLPLFPTFEKRRARRYGITVIPVLMNASPIPPSEKHVNRALCILGNKRFRPIYFHCDIGRDRTALVAALYEMYFRGASKEQAEQDMNRFGFKGGWSLHGLTSYFNKHPTAPTRGADICSHTQ